METLYIRFLDDDNEITFIRVTREQYKKIVKLFDTIGLDEFYAWGLVENIVNLDTD